MGIKVIPRPIPRLVKRILFGPFSFNKKQGLKRLMQANGRSYKNEYKVHEVVATISNYITAKGLFTKGNMDIICCPSELERALGVKTLHVGDVCYYLLRGQIQRLLALEWEKAESHNDEDSHQIDILSRDVEKIEELVNFSMEDPCVRYLCEKNLLLLFQSTLKIDKRRRVFAYKDIQKMLLEYLDKNNCKLQITENPDLFHVKNHPLGKILKMDWFSKAQIKQIMEKLTIQCKPM